MATLTERLAIVVEANAGKAIAEFKTLGNTTKNLSGDVGKAGGLISNLGGQLGSIAGAAGPAAAVGALGLAVAKFSASGVSGFIDLASQVAEFRRVAGGSAEDASKLVAGFKAVGVDATTAATGVFQLEKHLASGADKLAAFGVVAVKDRKGNTDMAQTLLSVGDAYRRIQDPVQKAALLTAAFGRQGTALIPLLSKSREEIQQFFDAAAKHGQVLSDDDLKSAREYKLAMRDLGEAFGGLQREAGKALVPFLTDTAHAITGVIDLINKVRDLAHIPTANSGFHGPGGWIDSLIHGGDAADAATTSTHSLGDALAQTSAIMDGFRENNAADEKALDALDKALQGAADADRSLTDAHLKADDAQRSYNDLLKKGAVDAEKVADAQRSLADAIRGVGHAEREQAKAQAAYNQAAAAAAILGTDTALDKKKEAADNLADANDNVASAIDRQKAAQADLDKSKAGDPDYQQKLAAAKQKLADATYDVSNKALAAAKAHDTEAKALKDDADQVDRVLGLYNQMIKKNPEVQQALQPAIWAAQASTGQNLGLAGFQPLPAGISGPPSPILGHTLPPGIAGPTAPVVNNVTVNVDGQVDPVHIAGKMLWALN